MAPITTEAMLRAVQLALQNVDAELQDINMKVRD